MGTKKCVQYNDLGTLYSTVPGIYIITKVKSNWFILPHQIYEVNLEFSSKTDLYQIALLILHKKHLRVNNQSYMLNNLSVDCG